MGDKPDVPIEDSGGAVREPSLKKGGEMTTQEFAKLKNKLEFLMRETNKLQQQHRRETGRRLIVPARLDGFESKFEIREVEND
jgi:hypothetical protein